MLIVAPWSSFWDRNFFVERLPAAAGWLNGPVVRGAVSGVGVVTTLAGLAEFGAAFARRHPSRAEPSAGPLQSDR